VPQLEPSETEQQQHDCRDCEVHRRRDDEQQAAVHAIRNDAHERRCDVAGHLAAGNDAHHQR
jgi:hypothetical protein